jgi:hypothetical protein
VLISLNARRRRGDEKMSAIMHKFINAAAKAYQKSMTKRLAMYGLKLEDLYVETPDVEKALHRIPNDVLVERYSL